MNYKKNPRSGSDTELAITEIKSVYADLAKRSQERNCTLKAQCCHFTLTGKTPFLTKGEAIVAAKALRHAGRKRLPERNDGACKLLHPTTSRCIIYEGRPFGCRTHFCQSAGGPYARKDVIDLIRRMETVDEQLQGSGPRELHAAVEDA